MPGDTATTEEVLRVIETLAREEWNKASHRAMAPMHWPSFLLAFRLGYLDALDSVLRAKENCDAD